MCCSWFAALSEDHPDHRDRPGIIEFGEAFLGLGSLGLILVRKGVSPFLEGGLPVSVGFVLCACASAFAAVISGFRLALLRPPDFLNPRRFQAASRDGSSINTR